ncbi:hypothetical protein CYMTET_47415 [Cymbomonas tetramitiformis]|uniref:Uncharacterized protein n=1 Tax=Cymbomonas tetramitiformis TaxID=36881 RepID=A0AAE0BW75_9CHLO|nr:hypothetical protein CYMTET_47415 [Cymbomonas tetramitiformis]
MEIEEDRPQGQAWDKGDTLEEIKERKADIRAQFSVWESSGFDKIEIGSCLYTECIKAVRDDLGAEVELNTTVYYGELALRNRVLLTTTIFKHCCDLFYVATREGEQVVLVAGASDVAKKILASTQSELTVDHLKNFGEQLLDFDQYTRVLSAAGEVFKGISSGDHDTQSEHSLLAISVATAYGYCIQES